jgi:hypothetical protein
VKGVERGLLLHERREMAYQCREKEDGAADAVATSFFTEGEPRWAS